LLESSNSRRVPIIVFSLIAAIALAAGVLITSLGGSSDGWFGRTEAGTGVTLDGQTASGLVPGDPDVVASDSVDEFTREYGEPAGTDFARIRIPVLGINAPVGRWLVDDSIMPEPYGPVDVALYDLSGWQGLGGMPGEGRNAILGAHVDLNRTVGYAGAHYRGPAVFWGIHRLSAGDIVEIDYLGETLRYAVVWSEDVPAGASSNWHQYWSSDVAVDSITMFTCGGDFDFETYEYSHRVVVRAERIN
jgi:sortase (surface protein transpeptidase)